jgi:hypothetical protein
VPEPWDRGTLGGRTRPCRLTEGAGGGFGLRRSRLAADGSFADEPVSVEVMNGAPDARPPLISRQTPHRIHIRRTGPSRRRLICGWYRRSRKLPPICPGQAWPKRPQISNIRLDDGWTCVRCEPGPPRSGLLSGSTESSSPSGLLADHRPFGVRAAIQSGWSLAIEFCPWTPEGGRVGTRVTGEEPPRATRRSRVCAAPDPTSSRSAVLWCGATLDGLVSSNREAVCGQRGGFMDRRAALSRRGSTYAEIGRMLGRDWRTVNQYIETGAPPAYRRRRDASKLDPLNRCSIVGSPPSLGCWQPACTVN